MMVPVGKIMKKILSLTAAGALATSGILAVQFIRPPEKAEAWGAGPCYVDVHQWKAYNRGCGPLAHLVFTTNNVYEGSRATAWNWSYQWMCYDRYIRSDFRWVK